MEHTANILEPNVSLITSLLKVFYMFQLHIFYDKHNEEYNVVDTISIKYSHYNKDTNLHLKKRINDH